MRKGISWKLQADSFFCCIIWDVIINFCIIGDTYNNNKKGSLENMHNIIYNQAMQIDKINIGLEA